MASKPTSSFTWLGKYLSLALVLPASVVAGYLIGTFAEHFLHWPLLPAAGIVLGMTSGLVHVFKEVSRDEKRQ
jgi:F0F1-type ATP synthase assembly protein I